jgi:hypothetical protein
LKEMSERDGKKQRDIRDWISSPGSSAKGTPARRRRVMSTSDSEAERNLGAESQQQQPHHQNANMINDGNPRDDDAGDNAQEERQVIQLDSSSDDSMYLPFPRQQGSEGAARPASRNHLGLGTGAVHVPLFRLIKVEPTKPCFAFPKIWRLTSMSDSM